MEGRRAPGLWLAAVTLCAWATACGFATRSDAFACERPEDCEDGRSCVEGWCVTGGGGGGGGGGGAPIVCSDPVCVIDCDAAGSCADGVDCSGSGDCTVHCNGAGSCAGPIVCGSGPCEVNCNGPTSCQSTIDCGDACSCDVDCDGSGSCGGSISCPFTGQCKNGRECTDRPASTCDRC
jgi:hypothetical protein